MTYNSRLIKVHVDQYELRLDISIAVSSSRSAYTTQELNDPESLMFIELNRCKSIHHSPFQKQQARLFRQIFIITITIEKDHCLSGVKRFTNGLKTR